MSRADCCSKAKQTKFYRVYAEDGTVVADVEHLVKAQFLARQNHGGYRRLQYHEAV